MLEELDSSRLGPEIVESASHGWAGNLLTRICHEIHISLKYN